MEERPKTCRWAVPRWREDDLDLDLLSTFHFCSSTPTLFNAGTRYQQLSFCYLTTISDDLAQRQRAALQVEWGDR
jgi:ribonucleotide reductase alpha subunit